MTTLLTTDRRFSLWSFTISHKTLLIRSVKTSQFNSRIDVLFSDVSYIGLPTLIQGLTVTVECEDDKGKTKDYKIVSGDFQGVVRAGGFAWNEDELDYNDRSFFEMVEGIRPSSQ